MTIEGPLLDAWPPASTRQLLAGVELDEAGEVRLTRDPYEHVVDVVAAFAPRAFRRPLEESELEAYASLAQPLLAAGRPFLEAVRVPLRAILSAPPFLYHGGEAGEMDDFGLATRLAYFLWRSMPDAELFELAGEGRLSDPRVLAEQVDRMLDDDRKRAVRAGLCGSGLPALRAEGDRPGRGTVSRVRRSAGTGDAAGDGAVPGRAGGREPWRRQPDRRRLHVREPPPGGALRHRRA